MPILQREVDLYPEDLFEHDAQAEDSDRNWWVLYTRSRREKDLMRRLLAKEIPFYGPIVPNRARTPSGRIRTSYVPLFPGYVFMYGDSSDRYEAMTTNCISRHMVAGDGNRLYGDLRQFHRLIQTETPLVREDRLTSGARVRVRHGTLAGIEGTVIRREGTVRLLVAVNFLQRGASLRLEDVDVEPI